MGFFSRLIKGIGKVIKSVVKGIKNVVKGVAKVVKKVARSKIFKAVMIAAALIVTGGAAIGAFGGTLATSSFGTWMISASSYITSIPVLGTVFKPFAALGSGVGKAAGATTDWLGITDKAARMGYKLDASGTWVVDKSKTFQTAGKSIVTGPSGLEGMELAEVTGSYPGADIAWGSDIARNQIVDPLTGNMINIPSGQIWDSATSGVVNMTEAQLIDRYPTLQAGQASVNAAGQVIDTASGNVLDLSTQAKGGGWRSFASTVGTSVASNVATGYIMNEMQDEQGGMMFAGDVEGKRYFDPLTIYGMDGRPLDINSAYENLLHGNGDYFANRGALYTQAV